MNVRIPAVLLTVIFLSVFIMLTVNEVFLGKRAAAQARQDQILADQEKQWAREDLSRKVAANEEHQKRTREFQGQLEAAWGGPAGAAWKNPDLSITQMLKQHAANCAPRGTSVEVRVDRFTEFQVNLGVRAGADKPQFAETGKCLLRHGIPYVRDVRFMQGGIVVAELDSAAIDSVADWGTVAAHEVEALFILPEAPAASGEIAVDKTTPVETPELTGDNKRFWDAERNFRQMVIEKGERIQVALQKQDDSTLLSEVHTLPGLKAKQGTLQESSAILTEMHNFFLHEDLELQTLLERAGLDPLLIKIEIRGASQRQADRRPYVEAFFDAAVDRQRSVDQFLTGMEGVWGKWSSEGTMVEFTSGEARTIYLNTSKKVIQKAEKIKNTWKSWLDWEASKK